MKIAYIIFNGITWLDLIGIYDPVGRLKTLNYLPDLEWDLCAFTETCQDHFGFRVVPNKIAQDLSAYDAIIVPGGYGTRQLQFETTFMDWIRTAEKVPYKISICTGSLLLGAAGFLEGKKATTNFAEYDNLKLYCGEVVRQRIVEDGQTITAGAVTASIDLGLFLCNKWSGPEAAAAIRKRLDYHG